MVNSVANGRRPVVGVADTSSGMAVVSIVTGNDGPVQDFWSPSGSR